MISQIEELAPGEKVSEYLNELIESYIFESGLDIGMLNSDPRLIIQGLMVYQVIDKRRRELDDIAKRK